MSVADTFAVKLKNGNDLPSPARDERLSKRLAERVGVRLLARGGQRYADAIIENLGMPGLEKSSCEACKRPYVQEWAVREMGHAMNRAMGHPSVQMQIVALIGADPDVARRAVSTMEQVEQLDEPARLELFRQALEDAGWRCLPPEANASNGHSPNGGRDANGNDAAP